MSPRNTIARSACLGLALAAGALATDSASAATINIHISGSQLGGWGVWVIFDTATFTNAGTAPNTGSIDFNVPGTGNPMDLLMPLPDGTVVDGTELKHFMGTVEVLGGLGTETVEFAIPDLWAHIGPLSLHIIFNADSYAMTLESVDPDGTLNYALDTNQPFGWGLESMGTVQQFELVADRIEFSAPAFIPPPCRADFDGNSTVNIFDILAFLDVWNTGGAAGDFDGNSTINIFDILAFLAEWNAGCP